MCFAGMQVNYAPETCDNCSVLFSMESLSSFGLGSVVCHAKVWSDLANLFHNLVYVHWS